MYLITCNLNDMFLKNKKIIFLTIIFASILLLFPGQKVNAECGGLEKENWLSAVGIEDGLLIPCECISSCIEYNNDGSCKTYRGKEGDCGFEQIVQMIVNFSKLILGVVGSLALLMFVYGGIMFIISQGNEEKITSAKNILKNAAIGIIIVFTAWIIVNFVIMALTKDYDLRHFMGWIK